MKIRNPWGQYEWNGAWGDNDSRWTPGMQEACNFRNGNDGEFFLSIEDYKEEFGDTTICAVYDDYDYQSVEHRESSSGNFTQFSIDEDCTAYITLNQMAKRMVSKRHNYDPFPSKLLLARLDDDGSMQYVGHKTAYWTDQCTYEAELTSGTYVAWTNIEWDPSKPIRKYHVSVYGKSQSEPTVFEGGDDHLNQIISSAGGSGYEVKNALRI